MKILRFMMVAIAAMAGLAACEKDCDHEFYEHDYTKELVGTWTMMDESWAEALIIEADGSITSIGYAYDEYWEKKGTVKVVNNKMIYSYDDGEEFEGRFELIPGESLSIIHIEDLVGDHDFRFTFNYCENDLADEVVGMWVCNETPSAEEDDMLIMTYNADGTTLFTGYAYEADVFSKNVEASYKVIGDLLIHKQPDIAVEYGLAQYSAMKLIYTPDATSLGDVMSLKAYAKVGENLVETTTSWLRVKQSLDLAGKSYDYNNLYVSNVKGKDQDFDFMGQTFNFSNMDGVKLDKMLKALLFNVEFPDGDAIKYSCHYSNSAEPAVVEAPIVVDGNKMTIQISEVYPGLKDVDMYTFQDQDNTQMHLYMPTHSFEAFFGNLEIIMLSQLGQLDKNDEEAVKAIYDRVAAAIESINLTLIMK